MRHNHLWVPPTSCLIMLQFFKIVLSCPTPLLQISPFSELRISHSNAKRSPPQAIWLQLLPTLFLLFKSIVFYFLRNRSNYKTCSDHKRSKFKAKTICLPTICEWGFRKWWWCIWQWWFWLNRDDGRDVSRYYQQFPLMRPRWKIHPTLIFLQPGVIVMMMMMKMTRRRKGVK